MRTTKMSLANIQGKLSRTEMKNIMAGSGGGSGACSANCNPGFVTIDPCTQTCTATSDVGVKCGTVKKCCFNQDCNP